MSVTSEQDCMVTGDELGSYTEHGLRIQILGPWRPWRPEAELEPLRRRLEPARLARATGSYLLSRGDRDLCAADAQTLDVVEFRQSVRLAEVGCERNAHEFLTAIR